MSILSQVRAWIRGTPQNSAWDVLVEAKEQLSRFLNDEKLQNSLVPEEIRALILSGPDVDTLPGADGEFGRDPRNPIPVNGPVGEVIYISSICTTAGSWLMGHRVGAIGTVDAYEVVSADGSFWDLLFFSMYHPRRSRLAPSGLQFDRRDEAFGLSACSIYVETFPRGISEAVASFAKGTLGLTGINKAGLRQRSNETRFIRPPGQIKKLEELKPSSQTVRRQNPKVAAILGEFDAACSFAAETIEAFSSGPEGNRREIVYFTGCVFAVLARRLYASHEWLVDQISTALEDLVGESLLSKSLTAAAAQEIFRQRLILYGPAIKKILDRTHKELSHDPLTSTFLAYYGDNTLTASSLGPELEDLVFDIERLVDRVA